MSLNSLRERLTEGQKARLAKIQKKKQEAFVVYRKTPTLLHLELRKLKAEEDRIIAKKYNSNL